MNFTRVSVDPDVWKTSFDKDMSTVYSNIMKETVIEYLPTRNRYLLSNQYDTTKELIEYLHSDKFKQLLIETIKTSERLVLMYPAEILTNLSNYTELHAELYKQDYSIHPPHLDYRTDILNGIIYFDEIDSFEHSTFVKTTDGVFRSSTIAGDGILILNGHNSWHWGGNSSKKPRYFILYTMSLKLSDK